MSRNTVFFDKGSSEAVGEAGAVGESGPGLKKKKT